MKGVGMGLMDGWMSARGVQRNWPTKDLKGLVGQSTVDQCGMRTSVSETTKQRKEAGIHTPHTHTNA